MARRKIPNPDNGECKNEAIEAGLSVDRKEGGRDELQVRLDLSFESILPFQ
jgi:hypothetical protein